MKLVKCIIRTDKLDETTDALKEIDVSGITVTHVAGHGRSKNPYGCWRGRAYEIRFLPRTMIDVVVADHLVEDVVRIALESAHTGERGDGRIFVMPVDEAYTIRTRVGGPD